jgi:hypothetical protein
MKKLLIVVMACYGLNARSQVNESNSFIRLYSDSTIYAEKIRLRPDVLGSLVLRADSRRIPVSQVKFFSNEDGFYANTKRLNVLNQVAFAERIIDGKINLYQQVSYEPVPVEMDYYRFRDRRVQTVGTRTFFNKGFSDLSKVNYANLSLAMADNAQSLDLLKSYRKSMRTGTIMYVSAGAAIIGSVVTLFSGNGFKDNDRKFGQMPEFKGGNKVGSFLLLGLGAGLGVGGFFVQTAGARNIERAVEVYNY